MSNCSNNLTLAAIAIRSVPSELEEMEHPIDGAQLNITYDMFRVESTAVNIQDSPKGESG